MGFLDWVRETKTDIAVHGSGGVRRASSKLLTGLLKKVGRYVNYGGSPFEDDWDVLVILDACRPDILAELSENGEFEWIGDVSTRYSAASSSPEFIKKCLIPLSIDRTQSMGLVSGNPNTVGNLDESAFGSVRNIGAVDRDEDNDWTHPRPITDNAITLWRDEDVEQMVVWYMQPHAPYPDLDTSDLPDRDVPWSELEYARCGEISDETVREAYTKTLERVLWEVEVLLENIDADDVIITADHAELLGEWGLYDHPEYAPVPSLKRVPWVDVSATDERTREPKSGFEDTRMDDQSDVEERLEALGYA